LYLFCISYGLNRFVPENCYESLKWSIRCTLFQSSGRFVYRRPRFGRKRVNFSASALVSIEFSQIYEILEIFRSYNILQGRSHKRKIMTSERVLDMIFLSRRCTAFGKRIPDTLQRHRRCLSPLIIIIIIIYDMISSSTSDDSSRQRRPAVVYFFLYIIYLYTVLYCALCSAYTYESSNVDLSSFGSPLDCSVFENKNWHANMSPLSRPGTAGTNDE